MGAKEIIDEITTLDERIAELRGQLDGAPVAELKQALAAQLEGALQGLGETDPLPLKLVRATDLACGLDEGAAALLAAGLDSKNPDARQLTGEALLSLTDEGVDPILPAVEHALATGGTAAEEMPFILAMVDDAEAPRQIERFLPHADPEVVASAVEALADTGDRESLAALEALADDGRPVSMDGGQGDASVSLGQLVKEAIEVITMDEEE
jgi:HEAT repeat protein